jgi:hypothetical protein
MRPCSESTSQPPESELGGHQNQVRPRPEVTGKQIGYDHMPKATSAPETEKKEQMARQPKTTNHAS